MRRMVRILLIVVGAALAMGSGCGADPETGELIRYDEEGNEVDAEGNLLDDEEVAGGEEAVEDVADEDVAVEDVSPNAPEICDGPIDDSCEWEPAEIDNVWGVYGDLEPANDWQTEPETAHRGENPNPPLPFFIVDLPDGVVDAPGNWALLGVQVDGSGLEGFTEGLEPRDPGCAPTTPVEAGAFLTGPDPRNVLVIDGWSTCVFETTPGAALTTYAYQGNEDGLFDYFATNTFAAEPGDWLLDIAPRSVTAVSPDGRRFPIVGDFDADGNDDLIWTGTY